MISKTDWKAAVEGSSPQAIAAALRNLNPNPSRTGALLSSGGHGPSQVAAEQVGHLLDGWRYLSAAFYSAMTNCPGNSVHLSYYAELRAVLSLLCSTGIRVKFRDAYYVNGSGGVIALSDWNTHDCVWKVWEEWRVRSDVLRLFLGSIKINASVSLDDIMSVLNTEMGIQFLESWGLDLVDPFNDHHTRNTASYESAVVVGEQAGLSDSTWERLRAAWELMAPGATGLQFDEALSSYCLYSYVSSMIDKRDVQELLNSEEFLNVSNLLENQLSLDRDFVSRVISDNSIYFGLFEAAKDDSGGFDNIMLRALFLLRVASAFLASALPHNAWFRERLAGWMDMIGLVEDGLGDLSVLWDDYSSALEEAPNVATQHDICGAKVNVHGMRLSRVEGVLAWAL